MKSRRRHHHFNLRSRGLALVRALYSGTMGGLQVPSNTLAAKFSPRTSLALATFIAATGYLGSGPIKFLALGWMG